MVTQGRVDHGRHEKPAFPVKTEHGRLAIAGIQCSPDSKSIRKISIDHPRGSHEAPAETLFDLASVTKLTTTTLTLHMVSMGLLSLDTQVGAVIPHVPARDATIKQLLTHTSGLPSTSTLWKRTLDQDPGHAKELLRQISPEAGPGLQHKYSCVGFALLGLILEQVSGARLDVLLTELITAPYNLQSIVYRPKEKVPSALIAPTELRPLSDPWRPGLVQGDVHDELAWALGGVSGNAGVFGTLDDVLMLGSLLARSGDDGGVLPRREWEWMGRAEIPYSSKIGYAQGLGARVYKANADASPVRTSGHTGYTGTALMWNPIDGHSFCILSNWAFPDRSLVPLSARLESTVASIATRACCSKRA